MTWYIISDLHLGDGSKKDNFQKSAGSFEKFADKAAEEKAGAYWWPLGGEYLWQ